MPGSTGPTVTLQIPSAFFVIDSLVAGSIQSAKKVASAALGACSRKVTLPSGRISGETMRLVWPRAQRVRSKARKSGRMGKVNQRCGQHRKWAGKRGRNRKLWLKSNGPLYAGRL